MARIRISIFLLIFPCFYFLKAQETQLVNLDSTNLYYTDYSEQFNFKLYTLFKLNTIEIKNNQDRLELNPNSPLGLGFSVNYKALGISLGIGLPQTQTNLSKYGKTSRVDFQVSFYLKNFGLDSYFQLYKGYYNSNPDDFIEWSKTAYPLLPEMRTISIGLSGYYVFNNEKYSNKAIISRTQVQHKSAGSLLLGVFLNYDEASSPDGFFPNELPDSIGSDFDLKGFMYFATGLTIGYTYTWVISKSFYLNGNIVPGVGYKDIRLVNNAGITEVERQAHAQLHLRAVLGYEHAFFYMGLTASTIIRNIEYNNYQLDIATEQIRLYIGKRF